MKTIYANLIYNQNWNDWPRRLEMLRIASSRFSAAFTWGLLLIASPALVRGQNTCDKAPQPCLDQPHENDTQAKGEATTNPAAGHRTPGATKIKTNDSSPQHAEVLTNGTFHLSALPPVAPTITTQPAAQTVTAGATASFSVSASGTPPLSYKWQKNSVAISGATSSTYTTPATTTSDNGAQFSVVVSNMAGSVTSSVVTLTVTAGTTEDVPTRFTLGLFGINATGSSSSGPSQQYFAELDLLAPLRWLGPRMCSEATSNDPLLQRCWVWLNPRIASVPSTTSTAISSLTSSALTTSFGNQSIGQITQSFEFQAGAEYYVLKPSSMPFWGAGKSWVKSGASLIFGGGILTPFNSITAAPEFGLSSNLAQQFNQNASLPSVYPQLALGLCNYGFTGSTCPSSPPATKPTTVAFVFPNRSRFYRSVYAGFRLRFFYFNGNCTDSPASAGCQEANTYPGTFDLRFGEDESVTGGHLVPLTVTVTGSFPIPGTKGALRVFGSSYLRAYGNRDTTALILVPSTNFTSLDNPAVVVQSIQRTDQDYFRLGIGLDLFPLLSKLKP
jgi:hypothetical protein